MTEDSGDCRSTGDRRGKDLGAGETVDSRFFAMSEARGVRCWPRMHSVRWAASTMPAIASFRQREERESDDGDRTDEGGAKRDDCRDTEVRVRREEELQIWLRNMNPYSLYFIFLSLKMLKKGLSI